MVHGLECGIGYGSEFSEVDYDVYIFHDDDMRQYVLHCSSNIFWFLLISLSAEFWCKGEMLVDFVGC